MGARINSYLDILVIWPIRIPLPLFVTRLINWIIPPQQSERDQPHDTATRDPRRLHFTLGLETAPVIGVLLLLASTCIPGSVITDGIVGSEGVRPYDIMTLFLSFVSYFPNDILLELSLRGFATPQDCHPATTTATLTRTTGLHLHLTGLYGSPTVSRPFGRYEIRIIRFIPLFRILLFLLPDRSDHRK